MLSFLFLPVFLLLTALGARAEKHTVSFENNCGKGTPQLYQSGNLLSSGNPYTSTGPLISAIAFLQTGPCSQDGEQCTTVELTLKNPDPSAPGSGSSTDVTLIPSHAFSVAAGFKYQNGCDGSGANCADANCPMAFRDPDDTTVQVQCQANDVNLVITFC